MANTGPLKTCESDLYLRGSLRVRLATQRKYLPNSQLASTCDYLLLRLARAF